MNTNIILNMIIFWNLIIKILWLILNKLCFLYYKKFALPSLFILDPLDIMNYKFECHFKFLKNFMYRYFLGKNIIINDQHNFVSINIKSALYHHYLFIPLE